MAIKQNESELKKNIFLFSYLMLFSIQRLHFAENSIKIRHHWKIVKTIEKKGTYFLYLVLSPNQYLRIPTDFAWSHHYDDTLTVHTILLVWLVVLLHLVMIVTYYWSHLRQTSISGCLKMWAASSDGCFYSLVPVTWENCQYTPGGSTKDKIKGGIQDDTIILCKLCHA